MVDPGLLSTIQNWRSRMKNLGLLGVLPDGVGYGNISVRVGGGSVGVPCEDPGVPGEPGSNPGPGLEQHPLFCISGSGTGGLERLDDSDLSLVTELRIEENFLACRGLSQASSESLSHATIYASRPDTGGVIHIHSESLWEEHRGVLPTTDPAFGYGTPEIAFALAEVCENLAKGGPGVVVMGGHRDGLMVFGRGLEEAGMEALRLVDAGR